MGVVCFICGKCDATIMDNGEVVFLYNKKAFASPTFPELKCHICNEHPLTEIKADINEVNA